MFDENIPRWIAASVNKHFEDNKENLTIYYNSIHPVGSDYCELRLSGPNVQQYTVDDMKLECIINILITSYIGNDDYEIYRMAGTIVKAYTPICVYKYGDGPNDDQTLFGTLTFVPDGEIFVHHFGLIDPSSNFRRSFVEANYQMFP